MPDYTQQYPDFSDAFKALQQQNATSDRQQSIQLKQLYATLDTLISLVEKQGKDVSKLREALDTVTGSATKQQFSDAYDKLKELTKYVSEAPKAAKQLMKDELPNLLLKVDDVATKNMLTHMLAQGDAINALVEQGKTALLRADSERLLLEDKERKNISFRDALLNRVFKWGDQVLAGLNTLIERFKPKWADIFKIAFALFGPHLIRFVSKSGEFIKSLSQFSLGWSGIKTALTAIPQLFTKFSGVFSKVSSAFTDFKVGLDIKAKELAVGGKGVGKFAGQAYLTGKSLITAIGDLPEIQMLKMGAKEMGTWLSKGVKTVMKPAEWLLKGITKVGDGLALGSNIFNRVVGIFLALHSKGAKFASILTMAQKGGAEALKKFAGFAKIAGKTFQVFLSVIDFFIGFFRTQTSAKGIAGVFDRLRGGIANVVANLLKLPQILWNLLASGLSTAVKDIPAIGKPLAEWIDKNAKLSDQSLYSAAGALVGMKAVDAKGTYTTWSGDRGGDGPLGDAPIRWQNESGDYSPKGLKASTLSAAKNLNTLLGGNMIVTSAYRDPYRMLDLWNSATPIPGNINRRNKYGNVMADPFRSHHKDGLAIDLPISYYKKNPTDFTRLAKKAGFNTVYPEKSAVHLEVKPDSKVKYDATNVSSPIKFASKEPIGESADKIAKSTDLQATSQSEVQSDEPKTWSQIVDAMVDAHRFSNEATNQAYAGMDDVARKYYSGFGTPSSSSVPKTAPQVPKPAPPVDTNVPSVTVDASPAGSIPVITDTELIQQQVALPIT